MLKKIYKKRKIYWKVCSFFVSGKCIYCIWIYKGLWKDYLMLKLRSLHVSTVFHNVVCDCWNYEIFMGVIVVSFLWLVTDSNKLNWEVLTVRKCDLFEILYMELSHFVPALKGLSLVGNVPAANISLLYETSILNINWIFTGNTIPWTGWQVACFKPPLA